MPSHRRTIEPARMCTLVLFILAGFGATAVAQGQSRAEEVGQAPPDSLVGSVSFDLYCASCHGRSGEGNGTVARSLRTAHADLTLLARRNGGTFPRERVTASIDGS